MAEEAPKAELIYHYSGVEAFMSIMRTRTVWLTDLYQANDAREGKEVIDVACAILAARGKRHPRDYLWAKEQDAGRRAQAVFRGTRAQGRRHQALKRTISA